MIMVEEEYANFTKDAWNNIKVLKDSQAIEMLRLVNESIEAVTKCAKQSQKISHNKHIEDKYKSALFELELNRTYAESFLVRVKAIGR
jgi:hypothetical protein